MEKMAPILSIENELFRIYIFYACVLALKVLIMSPLTAMHRFKNKAFANPEDVVTLKVKPKIHEDVERVRRAHLNDLENIVMFFVASFGYILTNPSVGFATMLFRIFTASRIIHTLVYAVYVIPQPARALACATGYAVTVYMAIQAILHFI
ncbi:hypothetical protein RN001_000708 [Aquatica leii]|uniref:Microsomal glutathione S-transferase 1 n=1 Tax=Aquatica leii TaxID=1421715 RepID=A0AAN7Q7D0_9COLE|nr:hypothetical protein RN001_000708 [Aquatica leii]